MQTIKQSLTENGFRVLKEDKGIVTGLTNTGLYFKFIYKGGNPQSYVDNLKQDLLAYTATA